MAPCASTCRIRGVQRVNRWRESSSPTHFRPAYRVIAALSISGRWICASPEYPERLAFMAWTIMTLASSIQLLACLLNQSALSTAVSPSSILGRHMRQLQYKVFAPNAAVIDISIKPVSRLVSWEHHSRARHVRFQWNGRLTPSSAPRPP